MSQYVEKALQHLTGKGNIDYVSLEDIQRIVDEHPYFAVGQILLSKKLKLLQSPSFLPQVQKTALYFTNPYWLHYQLMNDVPIINFTKTAEENLQHTKDVEEDEEKTSGLEVTENGTIKLADEDNDLQDVTEESFVETDATEATTIPEDIEPAEETVIGEEIPDKEVFLERDEVDDLGGIATDEAVESLSSEKLIPDESTENINLLENEIAIDKEEINENSTETNNQILLEPEQRLKPLEEENPVATQTSSRDDISGFSEEHSLLTLEDTYTLRPAENEYLDTPPLVDVVDEDGENLNIKQDNSPVNYQQTPPKNQDVIELDHPLIPNENIPPELESLTAEELLIDNEQSTDLTSLQAPFQTEHSLEPNDFKVPKENVAEEVSPDPFHPDFEEVLEEEQQEIVDKNAVETVIEPEKAEPVVTTKDVENPSSDVPADSPATIKPLIIDKEQTQQIENAAATEPLIPIEPYYTVDYFASQGIKFTPEKDPQDKLGKQLKSFTQWLRHMKRLGPEDSITSKEELQVESKIQGIADSSNVTQEVVTEAMAEVLEKQGKIEHAIEVYNKLSFLNPNKSTYFAGKIENLKGL